jgi:hypothetical protein
MDTGRSAWLWIVVVIVVTAACGGGPIRPTALPPDTTPLTAVPTRIEISGQDSVEPGETVQLTATAYFSDGTSKNVTDQGTWFSSDATVLALAGAGLVSARARGESFVSVDYGGVQAGRVLFGLPKGTYRLTGVVREDGRPIDGAQVEITSGAGAGLSDITEKGEYRIYGVAGDTQVRVIRPDFEPVVQSLDINANQSLDFDLKRGRTPG